MLQRTTTVHSPPLGVGCVGSMKEINVNRQMQELCAKAGVDFEDLYAGVCLNASGEHVIVDLTHEEWKVLQTALEIAGGL